MTLSYCVCACQGVDDTPPLDVLLLKQQVFAASGSNQGNDRAFQYAYGAYHRNHALLQFCSIKLVEWIAKNLADELPTSGEDRSSTQLNLNSILTGCLLSDRRGNSLHTSLTVEFESDLYRGVMRARYYPLNMDQYPLSWKEYQGA